MSASLPKSLLYSAYRFSAVHLAPDGSSKIINGTCFHVIAGDEIFVITNKHNFELSHSDEKYVGYKIDGLAISGYFARDEDSDDQSNFQFAEFDFLGQTIAFAFPTNDAEDVVAFDVTNVPFRFRRKRAPGEDRSLKTKKLSARGIDITMPAKENDLQKLNPGDAIAFPSYPQHYDVNGIRPIMRTGSIASDPVNDFQTQYQQLGRRVACEAHSTQGSSGSPVFAILQNSELVVLGINAGHLTGDEPKIGTIHSGLSYCFKAVCILESIEKLRSTRDQRA